MSTLAQLGALALADTDLSPTGAAGVNQNLVLWSGITAFITPLLIALVQQPRWSSTVRALIAIGGSTALALITTALEGKLTGERAVSSALLVITGAIFSYQTIWKNVAPALEVATSPKTRQPVPDAGI